MTRALRALRALRAQLTKSAKGTRMGAGSRAGCDARAPNRLWRARGCAGWEGRAGGRGKAAPSRSPPGTSQRIRPYRQVLAFPGRGAPFQRPQNSKILYFAQEWARAQRARALRARSEKPLGHLRVTSGSLAEKHCRGRESVMLRSCFGPRFKTGTETRPKHDRFAFPAVIFRK